MSGRTPLAYIAVAGLCILLHNVVMIAGDAIGMELWVAVLISFTAVSAAGYVLHGSFTFRQPLALSRYLRYSLAMSANIPLAFVTTWLWHEQLDFEMTVAAPLASLCMLALNFVLGRWAIAAPSVQLPAAR